MENEEIRRLERQVEFLTSFINDHRNNSAQNRVPAYQPKTVPTVPMVTKQHVANRNCYRWSAKSKTQSELPETLSKLVGSSALINQHSCSERNKGVYSNGSVQHQQQVQVRDLQNLNVIKPSAKPNKELHSASLLASPSLCRINSVGFVTKSENSETFSRPDISQLKKPSEKIVSQQKFKTVSYKTNSGINSLKSSQGDVAADNNRGFTPSPSSESGIFTKQVQKKRPSCSDKLLSHGKAGFKMPKTPSCGSNTVAFVSRYKLVKKALQNSHEKNMKGKMKMQPVGVLSPKTEYSSSGWKCSTRSYVCHETKTQKGWISKYSLKREVGDISQTDNCINAILGRKISNLSSNKYKFVNGNCSLVTGCSQKKRLLKIDQHLKSRYSARLLWQQRRWCAPKTSKSNPLSSSHIKVKPVIARQLHNLEMRCILPGKKSGGTKVRSSSENPSTRYCLYYNRFGRCNRGDLCQYIHDPEKVSVCTRFLRGTCKVTDCQFSHRVSKDKMPICSYFLRRACTRSDCPYSHVNVNKDAEVCMDFIRGYCANGELCKKKHMLVCMEFSDTGSCPRGDSCPMRHLKKTGNKRKVVKIETAVKKSKLDCEAPTAEDVNEKKNQSDASAKSSSDADDIHLPWKDRRLPAFISLKSTNTVIEPNIIKDNHNILSSSSGTSGNFIIHPRLEVVHDDRYKMIDAIIEESS